MSQQKTTCIALATLSPISQPGYHREGYNFLVKNINKIKNTRSSPLTDTLATQKKIKEFYQ